MSGGDVALRVQGNTQRAGGGNLRGIAHSGPRIWDAWREPERQLQAVEGDAEGGVWGFS